MVAVRASVASLEILASERQGRRFNQCPHHLPQFARRFGETSYPTRLLDLTISKSRVAEWTEDEVAKLMQAQNQASLFDQDTEQKSLKLLRKLPFEFHYQYECMVGGVATPYKHKLVDWEAGALYWNIHRRSDWQSAFRRKWLAEFQQRDVLLLMGTIHRFPNQWLIVSVLYPPKLPSEGLGQAALF